MASGSPLRARKHAVIVLLWLAAATQAQRSARRAARFELIDLVTDEDATSLATSEKDLAASMVQDAHGGLLGRIFINLGYEFSDAHAGAIALCMCVILLSIWFLCQNLDSHSGDVASEKDNGSLRVNSEELSESVQHWGTCLPLAASLPCFLDGVSFVIASGVLLRLDPTSDMHYLWLSFVVGSFQLGQIVCMFTSPELMDRFGRQRALTVIAIGQVLAFAIFVVFPYSPTALIFGRFLHGVFFGQSVAPVYISEMSLAATRGLGVSCAEVFTNAGCVVGIAALAMLGGSLQLMWGFFWLVTLFSLFCVSMLPRDALWPLAPEVDDTATPQHPTAGHEAALSSSPQTKKAYTEAAKQGLRIACALAFLQQASGEESVSGFCMHIARDSGLARPLLFALAMSLLALSCNIVSSGIVDCLGRRLLLLGGMSGIVVAWTCASLLLLSGARPLLIAGSVLSYVVFSALSIGPAYFVVATEVLPDEHRASGLATSLLVSRLTACASVLLFQIQIYHLSLAGVFAMYAVIMAGGVVFVYRVVPETAGKSFVQIQKLLAP